MGINLLHCAHGNERIITHNAICDTFATIVQDANIHIDALLSPLLNPLEGLTM
jgi:hypothetical protein